MNDQPIGPATTYSVRRGIATITLDRPENRNALSVELLDSLGDNLQRAQADDAVRIIVLTNTGPVFCAGADLRAAPGAAAPRHELVSILERILDSEKPVVGQLSGHCVGGGVGLAAACDISLAAEDVTLAFSEVRLGVAPAIISVVCLPKMRRGDALELFLSGERIPAERAAQLGLINRAVPRHAFDAAVAETVGRLVLGGPAALAVAKSLVARVPQLPRSEAFGWTAALSAELFASEEAALGVRAFRERTDPPWVPSEDSASVPIP